MKINTLGKTGIKVTDLCFGALPMGPLQKDMPAKRSAELVKHAVHRGINFIDTAQFYKTYEPIKLALNMLELRPVIATKSFAATYQDMEAAIEQALTEMGIEYIDIFHLHCPRSGKEVFEQREQALNCLTDYKKSGVIRAAGVSTHTVELTEYAAKVNEIDVVFPVINKSGIGIIDGTVSDMEKAIEKCASANKGIYLMKVLAGGTMINDYFSAMKFAAGIKNAASISVGMVSEREIDYNVEYFSVSDKSKIKTPMPEIKKKEFKVLLPVCNNCGKCIQACPNNAIQSVNEKAHIDSGVCITCGYCAGACPQFAIRMV